MNYYEQLGLSANASAEEIKEAYRSLIRLLHPDHHQDPQLQKVAEREVQKLNHIYAVLSEPDRRRKYNRDLAESSERAKPIIIHAPPPPPRGSLINRSSAAWMSAVGAFVLLLVWMATRPVQVDPAYLHDAGASVVEAQIPTQSHVVPASPPPPRAEAPPAPAVGNSLAVPQGSAIVPQGPPIVPQSSPLQTADRSSAEADALRQRLLRAMGERDAALSEVTRLQTRASTEKSVQRTAATTPVTRLAEQQKKAAPELKQIPAPVITAKVTPPPPPPDIPMVVHHPMTGSWVYRKPAEASKNKDLFPPEFIETTITEENGQVHGTYRARYHVTNRPVSPDVNFQFAGRLSGESGSLPWNGTGGSRGEVTLKLMADHSLKVDWTASQLGNLGFYRGTAVLVKRAD